MAPYSSHGKTQPLPLSYLRPQLTPTAIQNNVRPKTQREREEMCGKERTETVRETRVGIRKSCSFQHAEKLSSSLQYAQKTEATLKIWGKLT